MGKIAQNTINRGIAAGIYRNRAAPPMVLLNPIDGASFSSYSPFCSG